MFAEKLSSCSLVFLNDTLIHGLGFTLKISPSNDVVRKRALRLDRVNG